MTTPEQRGSPIDHEQFRDLFTDLGPQVRRWAVRAVGPDRADDVVAETFAVVWGRRDAVPTEVEHRRAWIFVVARHKARHVLARAGRDAALVGVLVDARPAGVTGDVADGVAASADAAAVLRALPETDREVLLLVGVEGLTPAQAAAVLDCSVTAMTTRLSRARARLERLGEASPPRDIPVEGRT